MGNVGSVWSVMVVGQSAAGISGLMVICCLFSFQWKEVVGSGSITERGGGGRSESLSLVTVLSLDQEFLLNQLLGFCKLHLFVLYKVHLWAV